jgi:RNA polymerase-interacting CarD/CdnL/TRCF family regulator
MLSHIERPILADQIRRAAQQREFPASEKRILEAAFSILSESRRTERLDGDTRAALATIFERAGSQ